MDLLNKTYIQIAERYRALTPGERLKVVLLGVIALLCIGYLATHQATEPMVDLMRGESLSAAQLQVMEAALGEAKLTGYEVRGRKIFVPHGRENEFMAALAKAKVMPRTLGAAQREAADAGSWYDVDSQRDRHRIKIGKQEDIASAICKMRGIETASVQLDADQPGGFREKTLTAAVWVKPFGTGQLDENMVLAIRHSVAGAVAGLKPENVTVTDLNGVQSWHGPIDTMTAHDPFRAFKQRREQELKAKILDALASIHNVTVALNVEWEPHRLERQENSIVEPKPSAVRVSIGVPEGYFRKIRSESGAGRSNWEVDSVGMKRFCEEESAKIQKHVAQLLPTTAGGADPVSLVTVTPFSDAVSEEMPESASSRMLGHPLSQSWAGAVAVVLALACLLALWTVMRPLPAAEAKNAESGDSSAGMARVPPHHIHLGQSTVAATTREELSALVENDPETAANVLRHWIGQG